MENEKSAVIIHFVRRRGILKLTVSVHLFCFIFAKTLNKTIKGLQVLTPRCSSGLPARKFRGLNLCCNYTLCANFL